MWFLDITNGIAHRDEKCPAFDMARSTAEADSVHYGFLACLHCVHEAKEGDHVRPDDTLGPELKPKERPTKKILVTRAEEFIAVRIITGLGYRILENHYDPTLDRIVLTIENAWNSQD